MCDKKKDQCCKKPALENAHEVPIITLPSVEEKQERKERDYREILKDEETLTPSQKWAIHYSASDVTKLLNWDRIHLSTGSLFAITLNGITGMSGMVYGYCDTCVKGNFIKFAVNDMKISPPLAELLYLCKVDMGRKIFWADCMGIEIGTGGTDPKRNCIDGIFRLEGTCICVDVKALAERYLDTIDRIATEEISKLKYAIPDDCKCVGSRVREYILSLEDKEQ